MKNDYVEAAIEHYKKQCKGNELTTTEKMAIEFVKTTYPDEFKEAIKDIKINKTNNDYLKNMPDIRFDKEGNPYYCKTISNVVFYLENSPKYKDKIKFEEYLGNAEINGEMVKDSSLAFIRKDIEDDLKFRSKEITDDAFAIICEKNKYNKAQDFLKSLHWDGRERIKTVFHDLFNVEDSELHREMSYKWFMSGVYRIMQPGYPIEGMIILTGAGGIGKSYFCNELACGLGNAENVIIGTSQSDKNSAVEVMKENWIINFDELSTLNKAELNVTKTFLTTRTDKTRLAWKHYMVNYPRHCIFIGSTNEDTFLRDYTDSRERRFWIMKCNTTGIDRAKDYLDNTDVKQLWAEAMSYYNEQQKAGINLCLNLDSRFVEEMTEEQQQFKTSNDDMDIELFLDILDGEYVVEQNGCIKSEADFISQCRGNYTEGDITYQVNKLPARWVNSQLRRKFKIQELLRFATDWEYKLVRYNGKHTKCYVRKFNRKEQVVETEADKEFFELTPY